MGLLAVAASLCFVGCSYPNFQFDTYTQVILGEPSLIAYWPLNEPMGSTTAVDLTGHGHNGTYTHPPAYPAFSAPGATSPAIPNPTLVQGQASIVRGDGPISANSDGDEGVGLNYNPACVDFKGDYVSIPWSTQTSVDLTKFTLEAWVEPDWSASDPPASHVVFDTRTPNFTGFGLYVDDQNNWSVSIGNGTVFTEYESNQPIVFGSSSYVAVTCDSSGTVNLWVNPLSATPAATKTISNSHYAAVDQSQSLAFFIGAGVSFEPPRTTDNGTGSPLFSFNGKIQDAALYDDVLGDGDIQSHFKNGAGL
jgi:Concanavalin A-like lectin/glucanases superfamily